MQVEEPDRIFGYPLEVVVGENVKKLELPLHFSLLGIGKGIPATPLPSLFSHSKPSRN